MGWGIGQEARTATPAAQHASTMGSRTPDPADMDSPAMERHGRAMTPTCAVLLDLDGTLIDSQPGISASCLAALRALGHEPDEPLDIRRFIGPPLEKTMRMLLQPLGDDRVDAAVAAYRPVVR